MVGERTRTRSSNSSSRESATTSTDLVELRFAGVRTYPTNGPRNNGPPVWMGFVDVGPNWAGS